MFDTKPPPTDLINSTLSTTLNSHIQYPIPKILNLNSISSHLPKNPNYYLKRNNTVITKHNRNITNLYVYSVQLSISQTFISSTPLPKTPISQLHSPVLKTI